MTRRTRLRLAGLRIPAFTLLACLGGATACDAPSAELDAEADVRVEGAWARPVAGPAPVTTADDPADPHAHHAGGGANGAVYLRLRNAGLEADRLVRVESPVARTVEVHESRVEDGVMRMRPVADVSIPAGGTIELRPGGLHVMLIGVHHALEPGDRFPLVLHLEKNGAWEVEVEVRAP